MVTAVSVAAVVAATLPWAALAQDNSTDVDYNVQSQPDLFPETVATNLLTFPDCNSGPLSKNQVCNTSAEPLDRAAALVSAMTLEELISNTANNGNGSSRLGLPSYSVWYEALHGLDRALLAGSGNFSWVTSYPQPILMSAALNRSLIRQVADEIATEARAFSNVGRYGVDGFAPNINPSRFPGWGRLQETPGEDSLVLTSAYAYEYITGLQGTDPRRMKIAATAKHLHGYDLENWHNNSRLGFNAIISQQEIAEYYTPPFEAAVKYAKAQSVMCSYNSVNGVPSCANGPLLQTLLRDTWEFSPDGYVSSDCDAVFNVFNPHNYSSNIVAAAAASLVAGTDNNCGQTMPMNLGAAFTQGLVSRDNIEVAMTRLYATLVRLGWFDGNESAYRQLTWDDVVKTNALNTSYEAAVQGMTLLKNDGTLPFSPSAVKSIAVIGPLANATTQMQGDYFTQAPFLISPLNAAEKAGFEVNYALGANISGMSTAGFAEAVDAAKKSDVILYFGGIDNSVEAEGLDRVDLAWPGKQLSLINELAQLNKSLVVFALGGGQMDSSSLKNDSRVNSLVWAGYPGQSGGTAMIDIAFGVQVPSGRLVTTQYPQEYANQFPATDMGLRPNGSKLGQTYIWYKGNAVYEFGHGLFYTEFQETKASSDNNTSVFNITELLSAPLSGNTHIELVPFVNFTANVENVGKRASPYTAMAFANTTAGPAPHPRKWLVGFDRLETIEPGQSAQMTISIALRDISRVDNSGNRIVFPGKYELAWNNERSIVHAFTLVGDAATLVTWPL